jgi:hypothetical protein
MLIWQYVKIWMWLYFDIEILFHIHYPRPGVVVCACNPSYLGSRGTKIESSGPAQTKLVKPCLKIKTKQQTNKKAGGVAQVVEPLPSTVGPSFNS